MAPWLRSLVVASALVLPSSARGAPLVDRLIAVVDHRPIFLSELKERGEPHLKRIRASTAETVQRDAAIAMMYSELLSKLIDQEIERREAEKLNITVEEKEIDAAIAQVSKGAGLTNEQLQKAVLETGLSMKQYREEIARQILEGKWLQTKLQTSAHAPKRGGADQEYMQAVEKFRRKLLDELRERTYVEVML